MGDLEVELGFGTRVVEGRGLRVDHQIHPPVVEVAGDFPHVQFVELRQAMVQLGFSVSFN